MKMNQEISVSDTHPVKSIAEITTEIITANNLEDITVSYTQNKATISGNKDGYQFTLNIESSNNGFIQSQSIFKKDLTPDAIIKEAKTLKKRGLTQVQIGKMLNKSQSYISKALKK